MTSTATATVATEAKAARRNRIFRAQITPTSIIESIAKNGKPYASMKAARVQTKKIDKPLTVVAFDKQLDEVRSTLAVGKTVELAVVYNGGSLKVIGLPLEKTVPANDLQGGTMPPANDDVDPVGDDLAPELDVAPVVAAAAQPEVVAEAEVETPASQMTAMEIAFADANLSRRRRLAGTLSVNR